MCGNRGRFHMLRRRNWIRHNEKAQKNLPFKEGVGSGEVKVIIGDFGSTEFGVKGRNSEVGVS